MSAKDTSGWRVRWEEFRAWRSRRPFTGGMLLILAGLIIGVAPFLVEDALRLLPNTSISLIYVMSSMFAFFIIGSGIVAMVQPDLSTVAGLSGIVLSILSILGAMAGLFVGLILGILGGSLCVAWEYEPQESELEDDI